MLLAATLLHEAPVAEERAAAQGLVLTGPVPSPVGALAVVLLADALYRDGEVDGWHG